MHLSWGARRMTLFWISALGHTARNQSSFLARQIYRHRPRALSLNACMATQGTSHRRSPPEESSTFMSMAGLRSSSFYALGSFSGLSSLGYPCLLAQGYLCSVILSMML